MANEHNNCHEGYILWMAWYRAFTSGADSMELWLAYEEHLKGCTECTQSFFTG